MTQIATLHRKNQGKQFTVVDDSRFIFHWHRPGESLPKLLQHPSGARFLLTQDAVNVALKFQRSKLLKIDVEAGLVLPAVSHVNDKGATVWDIPKPSRWLTHKAWAAYAAVCTVSAWGAYELTKVL